MSKQKRKPRQIAEVTDGGPEETAEILTAVEAAERCCIETGRIVERHRLTLKAAKEDHEEALAELHKCCQRRMEKLPLFKAEEVEAEE